MPLPVNEEGHRASAASHLPERPSDGISTMEYSLKKLRVDPGCRGFTGPVPPPLWIRVPLGAIQFVDRLYHNLTLYSFRQVLFDCQGSGVPGIES